MQVRLTEGMFVAETYDLEAAGDALVFSGPEKNRIRIPYGELLHFDLEGSGNALKRFILETASKVYEGRFLRSGDADRMLRLLREKCGCYVDVRLDMERK